MAVPAFSGADYAAALQEYTPQQIVGELESQFPEQDFARTGGSLRISGVPDYGNVSGSFLDPNLTGGTFDVLYNIPHLKPVFDTYLRPALTRLQAQPSPIDINLNTPAVPERLTTPPTGISAGSTNVPKNYELLHDYRRTPTPPSATTDIHTPILRDDMGIEAPDLPPVISPSVPSFDTGAEPIILNPPPAPTPAPPLVQPIQPENEAIVQPIADPTGVIELDPVQTLPNKTVITPTVTSSLPPALETAVAEPAVAEPIFFPKEDYKYEVVDPLGKDIDYATPIVPPPITDRDAISELPLADFDSEPSISVDELPTGGPDITQLPGQPQGEIPEIAPIMSAEELRNLFAEEQPPVAPPDDLTADEIIANVSPSATSVAGDPVAEVDDLPIHMVIPDSVPLPGSSVDPTIGRGVGYSDSGPWGYAYTRNLLTGGGQGPVVTQGPEVAWQRLAQPAPSTDYISNVGGIDRFPSDVSVQDILDARNRAINVPSYTGGVDGGSSFEGTPGGLNFDDTNINNIKESTQVEFVLDDSLGTSRNSDKVQYFNTDNDILLFENLEGMSGASKYNYEVTTDKFEGKKSNFILDVTDSVVGLMNDIGDFLGNPDAANQPEWLKDITKLDREKLLKSLKGLRDEMTTYYQSSEGTPWGRDIFNLGKTQKHGAIHPYAVMTALSNPPAALGIAVNTVFRDVTDAVKGAFRDEPNLKGNKFQDVLNYSFNLIGNGIKAIGKKAGKFLGDGVKSVFGVEPSADGSVAVEASTVKRAWDKAKIENPAIIEATKLFVGEGKPVTVYANEGAFRIALAERNQAEALKHLNEMGFESSIEDMQAGIDGLGDDVPQEFKEFLKALMKQRTAIK